MDDQGELVSGADVEIDGFTRTTDGFGRVPFLLNTGRYKVIAAVEGKSRETEADVESGKTTEIIVRDLLDNER